MIPKWLQYIKEGPKGLLLMVGVSKETIYDNILYDLFDTIGSSNYKYNHNSGELIIYGRRIKIIGAKDQGSEKYLRGKTLAGAYADEISLMPEGFFLQLLNRLSIQGSKLFATTNPDTPFHYLYKDYITDQKKIDMGMVEVIHFMLEDNPNLSEEYLQFIKHAYSGLWFKRNILGLWVLAEGVIYDNFTDDMIIDDTDIPDIVKYWIGVDYGSANPTAFLLAGLGVDHKLYLLDEYYHNGREGLQKSPSQYSKDYIKWTDNLKTPFGAKIRADRTFIDPSATAFVLQLYEDGVKNVVSADNSVKLGIELNCNLIGADMLRVHKKCKNTLQELGAYAWDSKAQKLGEDKPIKQFDHVMDSWRYITQSTRTVWSRYVN
jgi:PBSX family phage terminase large subunit